ncbi:MAG: DNA primase, partial [bacterium]|nr:DNA primase [bacterium]
MVRGTREYRVRGLNRNLSFELMRVNVRVSVGERYHIDTLDLYSARHRTLFINTVAEELGETRDVIKRDVGQLLLKLEELQEATIGTVLHPRESKISLTDREREEALDLLYDPFLMDRIRADFEKCGLVGETTNALVGYLATVSRKLDDPLALIIQSSSAAGKSSLMEAVLAFVPEEDQMQYTAMTGQSLFYMGETELAHKILAISEEVGVERAGYAIRTIQSEKHLRIASTGKDPKTGRLTTHQYQVNGPVQIILTTTAVEVNEELQNRSLVLTVDEARDQTQAIHRHQRAAETLDGLLGKRERDRLVRVHQNAQRLLQPLDVVNPYATQLTFLDNRLRTRRDHLKYLTLIRSTSLLHQFQRPLQSVTHHDQPVQYIEVTLEDIEAANRLAR